MYAVCCMYMYLSVGNCCTMTFDPDCKKGTNITMPYMYVVCSFHYRCLNSRAGVDFLKDNVCLCGVATMRVQSKRREEDIVFVTYENKVRG